MQENFEPEHQLRFSIEFLAVKNLAAPSQIFFKFTHELLGLARTQTYSASKSIEMTFSKEFHSHEFFMTSSDLIHSLTDLEIELYRKDKFQKDELLGNFLIDLSQMLSAELKKTDDSVVRVLDIWLKESFASLRIALYLEDLGPRGQVTQQAVPIHSSDWELELWRKAEESKFLSELKLRESDYLKSASQEWLAKESLRQEQNEKALLDLSALEIKLKSKLMDLQKRETKISSAEEEIKLTLADLQRQVQLKDEELALWKGKLGELNSGKELRGLKNLLVSLKEQAQKTDFEVLKLRKQADSQELKELKMELNVKLAENAEILSRWEGVKKVKDELEGKLNKLKGDLNKTLRVQDSERRVRQGQEREEMVKRRMELETIRYQHEECMQIKELKEKMVSFRTLIK